MKNIELNKAAKLAGIMFLFNLIIPTISYVTIHNKLFDASNPLHTVQNILGNEFLFRLSISIEIILAAGLIILGFALYKLLKPISNYLSALAFCFKIVEAIIVVIITLISFVALQLLQNETASIFSAEQLHGLIGNVLTQSTKIQSISMFFLGIEMIIFSYLLYKSRFIPRIISGLGIIAFILIFYHSVITILGLEITTMIITIPSFLFELIIGLWLVTKGINGNHIESFR